MGLFSKLFGGKSQVDSSSAPETAAEPEHPDAVIVLRRGMSVPKPEYLEGVLAVAFSGGLPESVARIALAQPSWFKNDEVADQIAAGVVEAFAAKLGVEGASSRRRALDGPDGCACLVIELYRG
ncbi:MAG TPA: hypothetical protein VII38_10055 [Polyangia bacterium]|jgi:hypothetical protein